MKDNDTGVKCICDENAEIKWYLNNKLVEHVEFAMWVSNRDKYNAALWEWFKMTAKKQSEEIGIEWTKENMVEFFEEHIKLKE